LQAVAQADFPYHHRLRQLGHAVSPMNAAHPGATGKTIEIPSRFTSGKSEPQSFQNGISGLAIIGACVTLT